MKHTSDTPGLSDAALNEHIEDLQSQLESLTISLQLATAEKNRRLTKGLSSKPSTSLQTSKKLISSLSPPTLQVGSHVRIRNKYRGNKGKIGKIITLSSKTATVQIPNEGNFVKYLHNLELLPQLEDDEK